MTREEKNQKISDLTEKFNDASVLYLADISQLDAESNSSLRRLCHKKEVKLQVVKNTLLKKALEKSDKDFEEFYDTLVGNTSIMFSEVGNAPAKIIKEFRKKHKKERPLLKGAYIDEGFYIGNEKVEMLSELKSKEELIGDIILLLQSPAKNVMGALNSGKDKLGGLVKALAEKAE